jgi:hypothetical protein
LGDSDEEEDAMSWVRKSRSLQKEKEEAAKRVLDLPLLSLFVNLITFLFRRNFLKKWMKNLVLEIWWRRSSGLPEK